MTKQSIEKGGVEEGVEEGREISTRSILEEIEQCRSRTYQWPIIVTVRKQCTACPVNISPSIISSSIKLTDEKVDTGVGWWLPHQ